MSTGCEPDAFGYELQSTDRSDTSFVSSPIEPDRSRSLGSYALVVDNAIATTGP